MLTSGVGGIGKSTLALQFVQHKFYKEYDPTFAECFAKNCIVDGTWFKLRVQDTVWQEEHGNTYVVVVVLR